MRFWFAASNYAFITGDTLALQQYSQTTCTSCQRFRQRIEEQYSAGGSFRGGEGTITEIEAAPLDENGTVVDVLYHENQVDRLDSAGKVTHTTPASDVPVTEFYTGWSPEGWSLFGYKFAAS